ncbi:ribose-phosphate diphosphokinase [Ferruginibacter sp. HRS2-29]|uniref:ribose-phosphate diphosphokinase n=1 Tax=Ferruginibacter sp. HRS2-29 TaxID=2487334 RepID=UPI0020CEB9B3|nr:ribose-phosphate diphosphokinase [Ferruginibacter sp. HRS2-29]MCP9750125.1 ribose-phosphate pyrophosphokinase [Ferruginibacter sp. HRS2-29]
MTTLNLINAAKSDIKYSLVTFPDSQPHIKIDTATLGDDRAVCRIITRISNPSDLLMPLFAKNVLSYEGFEKVELYISYLLAARMDRVMTGGEPFSLKVMANIINCAGFSKIRIFDPHSEVSTALLDNSYAISNTAFVADALKDYQSKTSSSTAEGFCIVSPDAGALKKIYKVAEALNGMEVVECMKNRDVKTGKLSGFKVFAENLAGKTCFIVDDICDGGGTFIGVAEELRKLNAAKVILVISHGIFSKGLSLQNVDEIYCTNSYKEIQEENAHITVIDVQKYL